MLQRYLSAHNEAKKEGMALFMDGDVIVSGQGYAERQALSGVGLEHVPQEITHSRAMGQSQQRRHRPHPVRPRCSPARGIKRRKEIDRRSEK